MAPGRGERRVPLLVRVTVAASAGVLSSTAKECSRSRAAGAVVTSVVMSVVRCPLCDGGRPRQRAGSPPRQKKKSRAWCCCWLVGWLSLVYEIMPLPPEGDRGTPGVASPGPAGRQLPVASIPVKP